MPARLDPETVRKWLHLAPGILAFAVRFLGPSGSIALTAGLLAFNLWLFPRLGGAELWRPAERARGDAPGMLFYPAALLILAVAAGGRLEVLAGAWGMLAFGDAAATLVGRRWGRRALPWNDAKTWVGSGAFFVVSWGAIAVLVWWTAAESYPPVALAAAAALVAGLGSVVESLPWTFDDNLSVTLLGGSALYLALEVGGDRGAHPFGGEVWSLALVVALAVIARWTGALDASGSVAGLFVAIGVWLGSGWQGLTLLFVFVVLGTAASRLRRRSRQGGEPEAPRGARNVLANGVAAAGCGLLAAWDPGGPALVAMTAALAAATADTVGGEIGLARGGRTWRVVDGKEVDPGTDGGVSLVGTAATVVSAAAIAVLGERLGLLNGPMALVVLAAATLGAGLDSFLGATLERHGLLDNEAVNLLSTMAGAWIAYQFAAIGL
jgi:uncharacterized protein (TIGR00297 family)